jgi:hypothetical protein
VSGRFDHVGLTVADPEGNLIELLDRTAATLESSRA